MSATVLDVGCRPRPKIGFVEQTIPGETVSPWSVYWSSSTSTADPVFAWTVSFAGGYVLRVDKDFDLHVRAVRGGP